MLKELLKSGSILAHSKTSTVVAVEASKYAVGAILEQDSPSIAFLSHCLSDSKMKWTTGDQELLEFIIPLRGWRVSLRGRNYIYMTDHEPMRYLQTKSRRSGRQQRGLDELQSHNFEVVYVPVVKNTVTDALSRRPDDIPEIHQMSLWNPGFKTRLSAS